MESLHKLLVSYLQWCEGCGITYSETKDNAAITLDFIEHLKHEPDFVKFLSINS